MKARMAFTSSEDPLEGGHPGDALGDTHHLPHHPAHLAGAVEDDVYQLPIGVVPGVAVGVSVQQRRGLLARHPAGAQGAGHPTWAHHLKQDGRRPRHPPAVGPLHHPAHHPAPAWVHPVVGAVHILSGVHIPVVFPHRLILEAVAVVVPTLGPCRAPVDRGRDEEGRRPQHQGPTQDTQEEGLPPAHRPPFYLSFVT